MTKLFEREDCFLDVEDTAIRNHHQAVFLYNYIEDLVKERDGDKATLLPTTKLSALMQEGAILYLLHLKGEDRQTVLDMWKGVMKEKADALQNSNS